MHANEFLQALAVVMGVAAVTTVLFRKLKQPVVLGYLLAGLIIGPHVPVPLVAEPVIVQTLSELGVILLMFSIGLEFSLSKLVKIGGVSALIAVLAASIMLWLGFTAGLVLGWTAREAIFTGAIVAISSTTIVIKAFHERAVSPKLRELVVGVLIAQDLIAILLLASLTALSSGTGLSATDLAKTTAKLAAFLAGLMALGMLVVPRTIRAVSAMQRPETTLVTSIGFCFGVALLAQRFGYSVALGAFIAGSLISESGEGKPIEKLIEPVRDMFAAVFFVSVGMMIEPQVIADHWTAVALLTVVVVVGQSMAMFLGAFLTGNGIRTSVQAGMALAQIGEFSFIIAGVGLAMNAVGGFLYPIAVAVSVLTSFMTPWLIRASDPVARFIDRRLPPRLQTFAALYGSWVEQLRRLPPRPTVRSGVQRLVKLLAIDVALFAVVIVGVSLGNVWLVDSLSTSLQLTEGAAQLLVLGSAAVVAGPLCFGIVRIARRLGGVLAQMALPDAASGQVDLAAAPRRALVVTLQLAVVLLVGLPLLALTRPFLPGPQAAVFFALLIIGLGVGFWRSAANLDGHVRAGAQVIVEVLAKQAKSATRHDSGALVDVNRMLPGIGEPLTVQMQSDSAALGRTLADINLRGLTGAMVLAIIRDGAGVSAVDSETLQVGDVLALAGSQEAVTAAQVLLAPAPIAQPSTTAPELAPLPATPSPPPTSPT